MIVYFRKSIVLVCNLSIVSLTRLVCFYFWCLPFTLMHKEFSINIEYETAKQVQSVKILKRNIQIQYQLQNVRYVIMSIPGRDALQPY